MATITRQPFAPLNDSRLKNLTSLKNRQNAAASSSPVKRKAADTFDATDFENVDPVAFSKRTKGSDKPNDVGFVKPSSFILTKSSSANDVAPCSSLTSPTKAAMLTPRSILNVKSPASKLNTNVARPSPLSTPAGRSPTRGKRSGILSSRRRAGGSGSFGRIDPPSFGLPSSRSSARSSPFSLDAALKGTISGYNRKAAAKPAPTSDLLDSSDSKSSWFFDIHEDTPEQEMTNLLQHSTCVLDISSDEESESKRQRERAEGKENVPPVDDVSQTSNNTAAASRSTRSARLSDEDAMAIEKSRSPLGEMDVKAYYSQGCDETSVIIVPGDEEEEKSNSANTPATLPSARHEDEENQENTHFEFAPELNTSSPLPAPIASEQPEQGTRTVDELMAKPTAVDADATPAPPAAVLQPMEGTGESFELWESGSAQDPASPPRC